MGQVLIAFQLIQMILSTVHAVEVALPGKPGAEKSQSVLEKVMSIAAMLNASQEQIQSFINAAVSFFNLTGIFKSDGTVATSGSFSIMSFLAHLLTSPAHPAPAASVPAASVPAASVPAASVPAVADTPAAPNVIAQVAQQLAPHNPNVGTVGGASVDPTMLAGG